MVSHDSRLVGVRWVLSFEALIMPILRLLLHLLTCASLYCFLNTFSLVSFLWFPWSLLPHFLCRSDWMSVLPTLRHGWFQYLGYFQYCSTCTFGLLLHHYCSPSIQSHHNYQSFPHQRDYMALQVIRDRFFGWLIKVQPQP